MKKIFESFKDIHNESNNIEPQDWNDVYDYVEDNKDKISSEKDLKKIVTKKFKWDDDVEDAAWAAATDLNLFETNAEDDDDMGDDDLNVILTQIDAADDIECGEMYDEIEEDDPAAEYYEENDDLSHVDERLKKKFVYKDGEKKVKYFSDKDGYKVVNGKEVKMTAKEKVNRKKGLKKRAKTLKKKIVSSTEKKKKEKLKEKNIKKAKAKLGTKYGKEFNA
jgi:hypothetical protein